MDDKAIFLPVAALAIWTLLVLLLLPVRRFRAVAQKKATPADFRYGESATIPGDVAIPNRAWMNLLEAPVLFYLACLIIFSLHATTQALVMLGWAYVGLRIIHTLIHVTYNHVLHRLTVFALSNVVLVTIWFQVIAALLQPAA